MNKKKIILTILLLVFSVSISFGQQEQSNSTDIDTGRNYPLKSDVEIINLSADINDGKAIATVTGGSKPYQYYWSKTNISLDSAVAKGLTEGQEYTLIVRDNSGDSLVRKIKVPVKSINEKFNSALTPIVNVMNKIIMADIFALLHLYDPIIRDDNGKIVKHPNGDPKKTNIPIVVVWLIIGAIFFTIYLGFINFRGFKLAIQHVAGKYDEKDVKGEVSHFQALTTALSATVGLGNISGVAIAIVLGGPGATFWMIVAGLLGMSTKFVECTLGVKYRDVDSKGVVSGGPMYYMSKAFKARKMPVLGKILAISFAFLMIGGSLGIGNMFQANQAFAQLRSIVPQIGDYDVIFGIVLAILVGIVVMGGIKSIAKVTDKIVPFMALFYVIMALAIIIININNTGEAFRLIIDGAFNSDALKGGIIGIMIVGFRRAAFSNEAGIGSAPVAHSAVKTKYPVTEGLVALLEPFIDTVVICTMTALVIIYTGFYSAENLTGVELTSAAFGSVFSWFPYLLVVAIILFAFSTMIAWSYYGFNGFKFIFGRYIKNDKILRNTYYAIFLIFIVIGSASSLGAIVDFSDMMILSMAFPNIFALYVLSKEVKIDLKQYLKKIS